MIYLINTITSWDEPPRARHQVAQALAKNHKVVFITRNEFGVPKLTWNVINPNLTLIKPYFPVDYRIRYRMPVINEIYQNWLFRNLLHSFKKPRVINFDHTATQIFKYFNDVVYYCNDDYTGISRRDNPKFIYKYHLIAEKQVAKKANFCVVTTEFLAEKLKKMNSNVFEIRLGGPSLDDYGITAIRYKKQSNTINIGFVGFIEPINISLIIIDALVAMSNCRLTLIGPEKRDCLKHYRTRENVFLKGILKGEDLYREINKFDVAIVPYSFQGHIDRTPNKIWQYLALGKPVVISNVHSIKQWLFPKGVIYKASTVDDFASLVLKAHEENNEHLINQRIEISKANTWDNRVADLLSIYKTFE